MTGKTSNEERGIQVISETRLEEMGRREKIRTVVENAKRGEITVLEKQLTDSEQSDLIDEVMSEVRDIPDFTGIDYKTTEATSSGGFFSKLTGSNDDDKLMIVVPDSRADSIDKDSDGLRILFGGGK